MLRLMAATAVCAAAFGGSADAPPEFDATSLRQRIEVLTPSARLQWPLDLTADLKLQGFDVVFPEYAGPTPDPNISVTPASFWATQAVVRPGSAVRGTVYFLVPSGPVSGTQRTFTLTSEGYSAIRVKLNVSLTQNDAGAVLKCPFRLDVPAPAPDGTYRMSIDGGAQTVPLFAFEVNRVAGAVREADWLARHGEDGPLRQTLDHIGEMMQDAYFTGQFALHYPDFDLPESIRDTGEIQYAIARARQMLLADDAVNHFQKAARLSPQIADAHYFLGEHAYMRGDLDVARVRLAEALRRDPAHLDALRLLAKVCREQGHFAEAEDLAQRIAQTERVTEYKVDGGGFTGKTNIDAEAAWLWPEPNSEARQSWLAREVRVQGHRISLEVAAKSHVSSKGPVRMRAYWNDESLGEFEAGRKDAWTSFHTPVLNASGKDGEFRVSFEGGAGLLMVKSFVVHEFAE